MSGKFDAAFSNETVDANSSVKHGGNLLRINSRRSHRDPTPFLQVVKRRETLERERMQPDCSDKINSTQTSNGADLGDVSDHVCQKMHTFFTIFGEMWMKKQRYFLLKSNPKFHIVRAKLGSYCVMNMPFFHKEIP